MLRSQLPYRATFTRLPVIKSNDLVCFQSHHFAPETPVKLTGFASEDHSIPAIQKWFTPLAKSRERTTYNLNMDLFRAHEHTEVPLEHTCVRSRPLDDHHSEQVQERHFNRLDLPLASFLGFITDTLRDPTTRTEDSGLYLAQCDLSNLPEELRNDIQAPQLVREAGKGDIYASSLWMGLPPTNTPLHKDPNPNILVQLAGRKTVRMVQPQAGRAVYEHTRRLCAAADGRPSAGGASVRGDEMMVGLEREILDTFMWEDGMPDSLEISGFEATLKPGEGAFVPKGWWHSVRGLGDYKDGVNASVCVPTKIQYSCLPGLGQLVVSMRRACQEVLVKLDTPNTRAL